MSIDTQVAVRSRKLGVLIRDARLAARKTIPECAVAIGVTNGIFRAYEEGRRSPSLPEMEFLAFYLGLPIRHFWGKEAKSEAAPLISALNLQALGALRQRMVGALLRQEREKASISIKALAEQAGVSGARLRAFELGTRPIPLPVLEALITLLGGQIESLLDQTGPVGQWINQQKAIQDFLQLPPELQEFVCKPVNLPYVELALKLSNLSTTKLRSVAEDLLDITL
jgi:transcriptional regulator with XRE-family HTH domain